MPADREAGALTLLVDWVASFFSWNPPHAAKPLQPISKSRASWTPTAATDRQEVLGEHLAIGAPFLSRFTRLKQPLVLSGYFFFVVREGRRQ